MQTIFRDKTLDDINSIKCAYLSGEKLDWDKIYRDVEYHKVSTVKYPFAKKKFGPRSIIKQTKGVEIMEKAVVMEEIKAIWTEVLESEEEIQTNESFFEIGGNSMLATLMVENINDKYSCELELTDIYENNTIEQLTDLVVSKCQG